MTDEVQVEYDDDTVKVFKLVTGEEIVARISKSTEHFFVIEIPLELRYNYTEKRLFLSRWIMGSDYSKVMTLAGTSIVSISGPEDLVLENYYNYREELVKSLTEPKESDEPEVEQIEMPDELLEKPTLH